MCSASVLTWSGSTSPVGISSHVLSLRLEQVAPGVRLDGIPPGGVLPLRPTLSFGRVASCDVRFHHAHLSGHVNFMIHLREGGAVLVSNYSRGAVRVNGAAANAREPIALLPGTVIEPMDVLTDAPAARLVVVPS